MKLKVIKGDITTFKGDALVNAANTMLTGSGGLTAAIFRAAGSGLAAECERIEKDPVTGVRCAEGHSRETDGYALSVKHIIHAVGPKWKGGGDGEAAKLRDLYTEIMQRANHEGYKNIAMPSLSTGHHGFPIHLASRIAIYTIGQALRHYPGLSVTIYAYSDVDFEWYSGILESAKSVFADFPEWVVHITGPFSGKAESLSCRDCLTYECRNAGKVGKFKVSYWVDNYPYFGLKTKVNGADFEAAHKHSFMAWCGGIRVEANSIARYIPDEIKYPVWLNGKPWRALDKNELADLVADAKTEFWVTDPRFMFAAYAALCESDKKIAAVLSASPTRYEAAAVLDRYCLRSAQPCLGAVHDAKFAGDYDCYPMLLKIQKDMLSHGANFVAHVIG